MRKIAKLTAIVAAATLALGACSKSSDSSSTTAKENELITVVVGANPVPHVEILEFISDNLAEEAGIKLDIRTYTDYIQPNVALDSDELDANYFQTPGYYEAQKAEFGYDFVLGAGVHVEPLALYSNKYKKLDEIPEGGTIVLNNDPANQDRGLKLLQDAGLIKIDSSVKLATILDITENPKKLNFVDAEGAAIPVQLPDVDAAVINGNYAIEAGLKQVDALHIENAINSPYANLLAWKADSKNLEGIKILEQLLHSEEVKKFINERYADKSVIPAF